MGQNERRHHRLFLTREPAEVAVFYQVGAVAIVLRVGHGTGHGVGVFLAVHEGPGRISKGLNPIALVPGMIYSNEPGYYKAGKYGIRIENLVIVREEKLSDEQEMMGLETITFAPIDKNMIETSLLNEDEKTWFNDYHAEVWDKLSPLMEGEAKDWLKEATAAL